MKKILLKILKRLGYTLLGLFVLGSILPYFLSVNKELIDESKPPFADSKFIKIDEARWHYRLNKPSADSLTKGNILLVHGFSGSTFCWRNNSPNFVDSGYRVLMVDLPAFGFSEKQYNKFNHSVTSHAQSIWRLIDSLGLKNEKWSLCGHSMGAGVVWEMHNEAASRVNKIFLVDGVAGMDGFSQPSILKFFLKYPPILRWANVLGKSTFFKPEKFKDLLESAYNRPASHEEASGYLRPFLIKNSGSAILEAMIYSKASKVKKNTPINIPVHIAWGSNDQWVPKATADSFMIKYPQSQLTMFEGAGHCPMETHAVDFNRWLLNNF